MSMTSVTFEAPEAALATIDEIAANMETDRATVLRDALAFYLADYEEEKAMIAEADRQFAAGETISHEEVLARFNTWKASVFVEKAA
jgi:predicted transcriptional regulator